MRVWICIGLAATLSMPILAQKAVKLGLNHAATTKSGPIEITLARNGHVASSDHYTDDAIEIPLKSGERLAIEVTHTNHLIYNYGLVKKEAEKTANAVAITRFIEVLTALQASMDVLPVTRSDEAQAAAESIAGGDSSQADQLVNAKNTVQINTGEIKEKIESIIALLKEVDPLKVQSDQPVARDGGSDQAMDRGPEQIVTGVDVVQHIVAGWQLKKQREDLEELYREIDAALETFRNASLKISQEIADLQEPARSKIGKIATIKTTISQLEPEIDLAQKALKEMQEESAVKEQKDRIDKAQEELKKAKAHQTISEAELKVVEAEAGTKIVHLHDRAQQLAVLLSQTTATYILMKRDKAEVFDALTELQTFEKLVNEADAPVTNKDFTINYNSEYNQPVDLTISEGEGIPADYKGNTRRRLGVIQFKIIPFSRLTIKPGVSAVYSFVKDPTFTAQLVDGDTTADEQYKITTTDEEYKAFAVGAMLQLVPRSWDNDDLAGSIDVGITADDSNLGLLLGGSLTFFRNRAGIGIGAIGQRVDELDEGLTVGDIIDTADLLKTRKTYDVGFYLAVSIKTK